MNLGLWQDTQTFKEFVTLVPMSPTVRTKRHWIISQITWAITLNFQMLQQTDWIGETLKPMVVSLILNLSINTFSSTMYATRQTSWSWTTQNGEVQRHGREVQRQLHKLDTQSMYEQERHPGQDRGPSIRFWMEGPSFEVTTALRHRKFGRISRNATPSHPD